mmetsp:Transcript_36006/g.50001  ORF Transcript_36006/g.50001 Transcript_36006/m.50001 type:complete len:135 (-) Transcript_36006:158-562(-)|eukprot:CAMPEP_0196580392 /NCGR_PEP_ID=MMETSP1081-20130531/28600_1 /TAXON_ID=36882 /ORGANISM="Pyramimonas amylifera, Strain CCMP720" /LENGTH=134 /DNA_ID=CAMNT_0041900247 /DNA_START=92 /DNA_END=496 /DNA_ORIENTATION=+
MFANVARVCVSPASISRRNTLSLRVGSCPVIKSKCVVASRRPVKIQALFSSGESSDAVTEVPALPPTPRGLPSPARVPDGLKPRYIGFYNAAEIINGRAAMIGIFGLCLVEAIAGKGILTMLGFEVGNGINIGF